MVGLDAVVGVLLSVMRDLEQHLVDHPQQWSGQVGSNLAGSAMIPGTVSKNRRAAAVLCLLET